MHLDYLLRDPVRGTPWAVALATEGMEKALSLAPVLVPPEAAWRSVVARTRGYSEIAVLSGLAVAPPLNL